MKFIFSIFLFWSSIFLSQTKVKVVDAENNQPIPYAKVTFISGEYRNSDENGTIELKQSEKINSIESFGYETFIVNIIQEVYQLKPKYDNIEPVNLYRAKNQKTFTQGKIRKELFSFSFSIKNITAVNFYPYKKEYPAILFIKKIRLLSEVRNTKKNGKAFLVFYKNEDGQPGVDVFKKLIIEVKLGKKITEINLENLHIVFPKEGIFVGVEGIMNEENSYWEKVQFTNKDGEKEMKMMQFHNPVFFMEKSNSKDLLMSFRNNRWVSHENLREKKQGRREIAMELELTD